MKMNRTIWTSIPIMPLPTQLHCILPIHRWVIENLGLAEIGTVRCYRFRVQDSLHALAQAYACRVRSMQLTHVSSVVLIAKSSWWQVPCISQMSQHLRNSLHHPWIAVNTKKEDGSVFNAHSRGSRIDIACRSVCDRDQNGIKRSSFFLGADQGIKTNSERLKSSDQRTFSAT